ncbi:MAG: DUF883 family protein [Verrucomicrobia bacterium]|nr:DUF883 family protein [Verrucomicrobiota bacterium]
METHFANLEQAHRSIARERVLADLRALAHDSESLLKATASDMGDKAQEARSRLAAALDRARATCDELQTQTVATAKAAAVRTDRVIRRYSYASVGVAFGVGLLLGLVLGRGRS